MRSSGLVPQRHVSRLPLQGYCQAAEHGEGPAAGGDVPAGANLHDDIGSQTIRWVGPVRPPAMPARTAAPVRGSAPIVPLMLLESARRPHRCPCWRWERIRTTSGSVPGLNLGLRPAAAAGPRTCLLTAPPKRAPRPSARRGFPAGRRRRHRGGPSLADRGSHGLGRARPDPGGRSRGLAFRRHPRAVRDDAHPGPPHHSARSVPSVFRPALSGLRDPQMGWRHEPSGRCTSRCRPAPRGARWSCCSECCPSQMRP